MPTVRRTPADIDLSKVDWDRVRRTTDAEIDAQIAADADTAPVWTEEDFATATRVAPPDVKALRDSLGLTQQAFADRFGFSVDTIRNYEQGHRQPNGPARVLLDVVAREPDAVARAVAASTRRADRA